MERSSKRGKIPQQDWPAIIKRYDAGETLSSIARTYDCSPPAISYIVSRSRARNAAGEGVKELSEPLLVRGHPNETPASNTYGEEGAPGGVPERQGDAQGPQAVGPSPAEVQSMETSVTALEPQSAPDRLEAVLLVPGGTTLE